MKILHKLFNGICDLIAACMISSDSWIQMFHHNQPEANQITHKLSNAVGRKDGVINQIMSLSVSSLDLIRNSAGN